MLNVESEPRPDALAVVDVDPASSKYGQIVGRVDMPGTGDELHHFGWNACSSALCPYAPHPHIERRYLIVPGLRSSRIHIVDTKPRSEEHTSELQSLMRISYAVFCLKKKKKKSNQSYKYNNTTII